MNSLPHNSRWQWQSSTFKHLQAPDTTDSKASAHRRRPNEKISLTSAPLERENWENRGKRARERGYAVRGREAVISWGKNSRKCGFYSAANSLYFISAIYCEQWVAPHGGERWLRSESSRETTRLWKLLKKFPSHNQDCSLIHEAVEPSKSFIAIIWQQQTDNENRWKNISAVRLFGLRSGISIIIAQLKTFYVKKSFLSRNNGKSGESFTTKHFIES